MNKFMVLLRQRFLLLIAISISILFLANCNGEDERVYLDAGIAAGAWIGAYEQELDSGLVWPVDPEDTKNVDYSLYSGTPGPILYFLEAYYSTDDVTYLEQAKRGADHLLTVLSTEQLGLYVGLSGHGFVLEETYKATGDRKYRDGVLQVLSLLQQEAQTMDIGLQWGDTTDIIAGNAGIGLFLLYAAQELADPAWLALAARAGDRLIEVGRPVETGLKWAMDEEYPRLMPNFSHGTAGIAYFLATLYQQTADQKYLNAALAGAEYLKSIANTEGNGCLIFHHEPEGEDLYYLGYCHGPVGTSRLFYRLYQISGDEEWMEWLQRSARSILESGIPEKETPGFWNNVSQCCGTAGVAQYFLDIYNVTKNESYLDFAQKLTDSLMDRSTQDERGLKWIQAEHRSRPEFLVAQTGYMQGAAGLGIWLLHFDAALNGSEHHQIVFPDSPF